jgi:nucleoside transporter
MKARLIVMNFLQFFVWGAWMITLGSYGFGERGWDGAQFGLVFSTMGFASLLMPTLFGILADKWKANRVYALLHLLFGGTMCFLPMMNAPIPFFWVLLVAMCFYMPTIGLNNAIGFIILQKEGKDPTLYFPPIRVWGTVGFIAAMWLTNFFTKAWGLGYSLKVSFIIAAAGAFLLSLYSFLLLPDVKKETSNIKRKQSIVEKFGLQAFQLFKERKMATFFIFSLLLGGALQLTNAYGDAFLQDTHIFPEGTLVFNFSTMILSISQISETLFILTIPFFMKKLGIKKVMLFSMLAWVLRFGLFGVSQNSALGLAFIISSCIIYGLAFDFFNISGALFVQENTKPDITASAQGIFMLMTNGVGAVLGNIIAGQVIKKWFEHGGIRTWNIGNFQSPCFFNIWFVFAAYALVISIAFVFIFKYKEPHPSHL